MSESHRKNWLRFFSLLALIFYASPNLCFNGVQYRSLRLSQLSPFTKISSVSKKESVLNSQDETFDDVWNRLKKEGILLPDDLDPRKWTINSDDERLFAEQFAKMSLKELEDVLKDLISGEYPTIESARDLLNHHSPLQAFIDTQLSDITLIHHVKSPKHRFLLISGVIRAMEEKGTFTEERKILYKKFILEARKYKVFLRELITRWTGPTELDNPPAKITSLVNSIQQSL